MMKKTFSKVVATICVMALVFASVFTGAISVSAAETATCTVAGYKYSVGAIDTYVGYEVTFTSSTAFVAGQFTITVPNTLRFVDCLVKTSSTGTKPNVALNVTNNKVLFYGFGETTASDFNPMTSLTLVLYFTPTTAIKDAAAGATWQITVGSISITNAAEATYNCSNATGTAHVHNFTNASTSNGITTKTCSVAGCGATDKTIAQGTTVGTNNLADTKYASLSFTADGDTILNALVNKNTVDSYYNVSRLFFVYTYKDDTSAIKTATSTSSGVINKGGTDYYVFPCGRNGGIGRMSRNITGNFVYVATNGGQSISAKWEYSIKSYLSTLISSGTSAEKNYAKALWNYGYYTTKRLEATQAGFFDAELAAYGGTTYNDITGWSLPSSSTGKTNSGTGSWKISGVKVTTGFKPKMQLKVNATGNVTVEVYDSTDGTSGNLVYKKTVSATSGTYFTISDIPTKYLTGTIKVTMSGYTKSLEYSFGRYAKARDAASAADKEVFLWMMRYAYYLGQAF